MALRGTLKDFGIADIFQLIGHQGKTGTLTVRNRDQHVTIHFSDGNVLRAESSTRDQRDLLGAMLVRAEAITDEQLSLALETQKRTLKRLGDILVESGAMDRDALKEFTKLQTTETVYRLFLWDNGTYEFKQAEIKKDGDEESIRSESVLMEGFRQVDEWPSIRKKISGYGMTFYKLEDLDELLADSGKQEEEKKGEDDDPFGGLDDAFDEFDLGDASPKDARLKNIGANERLVYGLITHDRDVQKIIDLSRLGEFETCKALVALVDAQIIEPLPEGGIKKPSAAATVGGITTTQHPKWITLAVRAGLVIAGLVGAVAGLGQMGIQPQQLFADSRKDAYVEKGLENIVARGRLQHIDHLVRVYHAQYGKYPESLQTLVDEGVLEASDLTFPWDSEYFYRRDGDGYRLLRPVY